MKHVSAILSIWFMTLFFNEVVFSQTSDDILLDLDLGFKIEEVEKKPYSINANIETKETISFLDQDALLFKQKYLDNKKEEVAWQTDLDLTIEAQYQKDSFTLYGRFNGLFYYNDEEYFESQRKAEEAYVSFQPSFSWAFDAGKKVHKW